jgi:putative peptidoglycan lipid II flippase
VPVYFSVAVQEVNAIIDRMLASGLQEGSISAMKYASTLRALPDGIITASVITVLYPMLSKYAAGKDLPNVKALMSKAVSLLFMALLPVTAISLYYNRDIVKIVFERGLFTAGETAVTANIFVYTVISVFFIGGMNLLNNTFYSMQDTKTPRNNAIISVGSNIVLNLILVRYMQAAGLALATSISFFINFVLLLIQFRRKLGAFGGLRLFINMSKCAAGALFMGPVFFLCEPLRARLPLFAFFGAGAIISLAVYALILFILRMELLMDALARVKLLFVKKE